MFIGTNFSSERSELSLELQHISDSKHNLRQKSEMKLFSSFPLLVLSFLFIGPSLSFSQTPTPSRSLYSVAHFRLGLSTLREFGVAFNPFLKSNPKMILGFGYRYDLPVFKNIGCILTEQADMGINMHGPYISLGYDTKNGIRNRPNSYALEINVRYTTGEDVETSEEVTCWGDRSKISIVNYDLSATDLVFKINADKQVADKKVGLYFGAGFGFRFLTREYSKNYRIIHHISNYKVEHLLQFVPSIDFGIRYSFMRESR